MLKPDEPNVYNTLALIEIEQGNFTEALRLVQEALNLSPRQPYYLNNRGFIYLNQNELIKAEADINESISIDPYNAWAYRNKVILSLVKKDYKYAERLLKQALDTDPFVDKIYFYLGMAYLNNGNPDMACASFNKSEALGDRMVTDEQKRKCNTK